MGDCPHARPVRGRSPTGSAVCSETPRCGANPGRRASEGQLSPVQSRHLRVSAGFKAHKMQKKAPPPSPAPLPPQYYQTHHSGADYILLPPYRPPSCRRRVFFSSIVILLLFAFALFFFWPSDPDLSVVRLRLDRINVSSRKLISLDVSIALTVKVRNKDFFSLKYNSLVVSIGYRGRQLGFVTSQGGHIRARGSSYIDATLQLNGVEVLHDAIYLIEDMISGSIPFDTVTRVDGNLGVLFFSIPVQGRLSCEVSVNTDNQTIVRQDCYPE
ncbi:hypothetical protein H6P81_003309 [Aristolochia fimbriata]|uniref:Late embryogenesis abundant protein LEA-2 subgroup domain-containing protein n=1 Tax=Aristolochia fimbriata TaxID=158543 RepID=A0AAV7FFF7_ARIFI|nr:hypothetical protein H6P81_003309 [Aristolochia fimbriata]